MVSIMMILIAIALLSGARAAERNADEVEKEPRLRRATWAGNRQEYVLTKRHLALPSRILAVALLLGALLAWIV